MTTLAQVYKPNLARIALVRNWDKLIEKLLPRPCMIVSVGLILAGLTIPVLMVVQLFQPSFLLGFGALALVAAGGVLALIFCGEI
jgi:type IV secretory pathway VirB3-like protein